MQIKNNILLIFILVLSLVSSKITAEEFNLSATEVIVNTENNSVIGKGSVEVKDQEGRVIKADKALYKKSEELLIVEGSVEVFDLDGNIIQTDKAIYNKKNEIITTLLNSKIQMENGYQINSNKIIYNNMEKIISSDQNSVLTDLDGNIITVSMFQHFFEKNLFSSIGKITIIDSKKNKYFFKELHVDTKKREMIGSDVSVVLDEENFGVSKENDPRFVANDIFVSKNKSDLSKGIFTICKKRDEKCPPWSLQAKKISHDKIKKTIYYEHATLKVYDIPVFYFPRFFHPDPTVKRQSGFLTPFFSTSNTVGTGFGLPYYWAINNDRDLTFTPKLYNNENAVLLNEYRQAFKNGFFILDTSYNDGYQNTSTKKTSGSRNHIFAELDLDLGKNKDFDSDLSIKVQRTSNDTYFRIHDINTALVDAENTNLKNEIIYNYSKDNTFFNISSYVYENLRVKNSSRYEHILPNILFGKSFFTQKYGTIDLKSNAFYKNYETNKHLTVLTNDMIWSPSSFITKSGFVNSLEAMVQNTNYEAVNTTDYKTEGSINEITSVLSFKSSLPMKKDNINFSNIFSPNLMLRYAPGHMRDMSGDDISLKYTNLYTINKTSEIEDGLSAILGFDFKINSKKDNKEKFSLSIGQVFSSEKNKDLPSKSSLDQKMSDVVGEIDYNFSEIGSISYKYALDHNLNDLNYNEISSSLNFGKVSFNLDYLEEQNHVGNENYINSGIALSINNNNTLSFETKKNFKTNSTELYDISYQYAIDCLTAGLVYRREFYEDSDVEQKDSLMFTITFVPFTGVTTPSFINP